MNPLRVLAFCGLLSGALSSVGGLTGQLWLVGVGSSVMLAGNIQALIRNST